MQQLVLIIHVLAALGIVALVLLQNGKGSDVGAAFGAGSANTMLGSAGALPFLLKVTALLGVIFFITSLTLAHMTATEKKAQSIVTMPQTTQPIIPVEPAVSQSPIQSDTKNTTDKKSSLNSSSSLKSKSVAGSKTSNNKSKSSQ